MLVTPINAVNSVSNSSSEKKKVSNYVTFDRPEPVKKKPESGALKSYFLGGLAAKVSFGGFPVSTGSFITKRIDDVPCSCCGGRMVRNSEMDKKSREYLGLKGDKLADKIESEKDFFRTPQRVVMMLSAEEARKNPSYDLSRAKSAIGKTLEERTQQYCINSLRAADEIVKATYGEEHETSKILNREIEKIEKGKIERLPLTEQLVQQQGSMSPEIYETVLDAAMNIPASFGEVKRAYGEAHGNAQAIAKALLKPSMQTIEHIHPKSLGGPNATQNFIAECADCNNPRGNMSYSQWLKVHPEFPLKAQDHIEWFQQQVVNGRIDSNYDDYGVDVKKTLSKESKGIIELKVLNPEKIQQMREAKKLHNDVSVKKEISLEYDFEESQKTEDDK